MATSGDFCVATDSWMRGPLQRRKRPLSPLARGRVFRGRERARPVTCAWHGAMLRGPRHDPLNAQSVVAESLQHTGDPPM